MTPRIEKYMLIIMHDMFLRTKAVHEVHVIPLERGLLRRPRWQVKTVYEGPSGLDCIYSDDFKNQAEAVQYKDDIVSQVKLQSEDLK